MEDLLAGKALHIQLDEQIVFDQLDYRESSIWSLLLASGYLKVEKHTIDVRRGRGEYDLVLTNKEVHIMFEQMILEFKVHDPGAEKTLQDTVCAAHEQIERKQYDAVLISGGCKAGADKKVWFCL